MNSLKVLEHLVNQFEKKAEILQGGESTLSYQRAYQQAQFYKQQIEAANESGRVEAWAGWKHPGEKALAAIKSIFQRQKIEHELKEWAKLDVMTNYKEVFTDAQQNEFYKLLDQYNNYHHEYGFEPSRASQKANITKMATSEAFSKIIGQYESAVEMLDALVEGMTLSAQKVLEDPENEPIFDLLMKQAYLVNQAIEAIKPEIEKIDNEIVGKAYSDKPTQ